jgi:hypothetical protein
VLKELVKDKTFHLRNNAEWYEQSPFQLSPHNGISSKFLYHLLSPASPTRACKVTHARLQVALASTIAHEVSHAAYYLCCWSSPKKFIYPHNFSLSNATGEKIIGHNEKRAYSILYRESKKHEPFVFCSDVINEVGWSFEHVLWGGVYLDILVDKDEVDKALARKEQSRLDFPSPGVLVDDEWLRALFRKGVWKHFKSHVGKPMRGVEKPKEFYVHRYLKDVQEFTAVRSNDGRAQTPHDYLNTTEGRIKGDVREWYQDVHAMDVAEAIKTGQWYEQKMVSGGPDSCWGTGSKICRIEDREPDAPRHKAPWLYLPQANPGSLSTDD